MSKHKITQAKPGFGNSRSFSMRATRRTFEPNLQSKRLFVPELGRTVRVKVSVGELRTIDKIGLAEFLKRQGKTVQDLA
jgi:large subunit ribosomal protein L28